MRKIYCKFSEHLFLKNTSGWLLLSVVKKLSRLFLQYSTVEWALFCKYAVCFERTLYDAWCNTDVFNMSGMSRKLIANSFNEQLAEQRSWMTRMKIFRFIQIKKKLANCHAINQTCITYSCIPGESNSKVALDSHPFHPASSFQFPRKKYGS